MKKEQVAALFGLDAASPLFERALTHSSYAAEQKCESYERLEFLGDAALGLAIAELIITEYPELDEGTGSMVRAAVVCEAALADIARQYEIGSHIKRGIGESMRSGVPQASILADCVEALLGAVQLERGSEQVKAVVRALWGSRLSDAALSPRAPDPKSELRVETARRNLPEPLYRVTCSTPHGAHATVYRAIVTVAGHLIGSGTASSKKKATQAAALEALEALEAPHLPLFLRKDLVLASR